MAATCAAYLLSHAGFTIHWQPAGRARLPAIMLSESALGLIRDVFASPDLFRRAHGIRRREVAWRPSEPSAVFEHSAVVVSEEELLAELPCPALFADAAAAVSLVASRSENAHRFGTRTAEGSRVALKPGADSAACCIESFAEGWLFLVPNGPQSAWLLSVGAGDLLSDSRVIAPRIESRQAAAGRFPCYPAIAQQLAGPDWLPCGSAAMAFDPICGDGTAHAVREAVLAAAVVRAAQDGEPWETVSAHYESRMILGFRRHLALALSFYRSGHGGAWWTAEADAAAAGIEWCDQRAQAFGPPRYRLEGAELRRI